MTIDQDLFQDRHIGPSPDDQAAMLATLGYDSLDAFIDAVVPEDIRLRQPLRIPPAISEQEALEKLHKLAAQNQIFRSYLGMGYHDCFTPAVIQRNVLENPGWYTAYTPYQPEIAQGRLEALLNFQTMVSDLTGLEIANASLLDEGTAAAEAMHLTEAVATDLLALTLLAPPGEWGADIAVGNSQRFGVPLGYGGPHAAFFATRDEFKRHLPGRIIGVSKDRAGRTGLRMALQTREQHIRREKATSNVCTAQVLLAVIAAMYAVYHGPEGLRRIARRVHAHMTGLAAALEKLGYSLAYRHFFDTLAVEVPQDVLPRIIDAARAKLINLRTLSQTRIGVALDETVTADDVADVIAAFAVGVNGAGGGGTTRSEEHTSELQSPCNLVCRLLLEKKKNNTSYNIQLDL